MENIESLMAMRVETVRELLRHLDRPTVLRIFDRMSKTPPRNGQLASRLMSVVLELLNGGRREHARRLWTSWLEPVLVRDHLGPASGRPLPGTVNATDAAAWWSVLAPHMAELVADVQERVAERARRAPLDRILESEEAERWAETLRRRSVITLRTARSNPQVLDAMLHAANAERSRLAGVPLERLRPLDARDLDTLLAVLEAMPAWYAADWREREHDHLLASVRGALSADCQAGTA
ncbi:MAG TPA: hypothetical protein VD978_20415 [Azospirillum sp.]|nr:hypothetical protein [Azospirillum sp.]